MEHRYMTLRELSSFLGLSFGTLRNWKCYSPHKLPPHVVIATGGREMWRFSAEEVEAWLRKDGR